MVCIFGQCSGFSGTLRCKFLCGVVLDDSPLYAYWDVTGDGLPDINPAAVFIGGPSGTHRADQLYFDGDGVTPLSIPYKSLLTVTGSGSPTNLGTFFADNGDLLSDVSKWSGSFAAELAGNFGADPVAHTGVINFAKATFAGVTGFINSQAITMFIKIQVQKDGQGTSTNGGNLLTLPINTTQETLNMPADICTFGVLGSTDNAFFACFVNEAAGNNSRCGRLTQPWTNDNFINDVDSRGIQFCKTDYADTNSATGESLYFFGAAGALTRRLFRTQITGYDVDGMPNFSAEVDNAVFSPTLGMNTPFCISQNERHSGVPGVICSAPTQVFARSNSGTYAAPVLNVNTATLTAFVGEIGTVLSMDCDSSNRYYVVGTGEIVMYTYSGGTGATDWSNAANWSKSVIRTAFSAQGIAADQSRVVNSHPTLFLTDNAGNTIVKITRNATGPTGTATDWDDVVIAGSGVAGNADGIGLAATFTAPYGIHASPLDNLIYITQQSSNNTRTFDPDSGQVSQFRGDFGIAGSINATSS